MNEDSDDDNDIDNDIDEAEEWKVLEAEKQTRLEKLVPALPEEEWGRKQQISIVDDNTDEKINSNVESVPSRKDKQAKYDASELLPPKMRPPVFTKEKYDGVESDSDDDEPDEADLPPAGTLGRRIALMRWGEGEDKSAKVEELDDEDEHQAEEEEDKRRRAKLVFDDSADEEMQRRVWGGEDADDDADDIPVEGGGDVEMEGEGDVDMLEEQEEFLKFSRDALGISDEMWDGILGDRRARGGKLTRDGCYGLEARRAQLTVPMYSFRPSAIYQDKD